MKRSPTAAAKTLLHVEEDYGAGQRRVLTFSMASTFEEILFIVRTLVTACAKTKWVVEFTQEDRLQQTLKLNPNSDQLQSSLLTPDHSDRR
jgi:hypothetical protein